MAQFGAEHIAMLVVIALAAVACTLVARRIRDEVLIDRVLRRSGWAMLVLTILWTAWGLVPAHWTIEQSLPFHFSDALRVVTAVALITRAGWAVAVLYFWGLTLNLQSVLTPDLQYLQFPLLEFAMYWILHAVVLIAPIVLTWGLGYRPTWRGYAAAFGATVLWAAIAFIVNLITGANYSYVSGGPAGASLLDVLGPWPLYLASAALLMAGVWALMTWPWETSAQRARSRIADPAGLIRRADQCVGGSPQAEPAAGGAVG